MFELPPKEVQSVAASWIPPEILVFLLCLAVLAVLAALDTDAHGQRVRVQVFG